MTIAERFTAAVVDAAAPDLAGPELLPVRLARASARVLRVDGAGLSLTDGSGRRIPLAASGPYATLAERLQFTVGTGPCTAAEQSREPVFAVLDDLRRRWPAFADLLAGRTPYRAVVALPLPQALSGRGALNLYFTDESAVPDLDVFEAMAVGELATSALSEAAVWSTWPADRGPAWLQSPAARQRAEVWNAIAQLGFLFEVDYPEALALLRASAYAAGRSVDDLAADLLAGRVHPRELRPQATDGLS
ncbi:MAG TPA: GAF domain-containing protein [Geodermatophilus sp.]|nr:GAF domain-containing protein [Geodermatophilus sp.]